MEIREMLDRKVMPALDDLEALALRRPNVAYATAIGLILAFPAFGLLIGVTHGNVLGPLRASLRSTARMIVLVAKTARKP